MFASSDQNLLQLATIFRKVLLVRTTKIRDNGDNRTFTIRFC